MFRAILNCTNVTGRASRSEYWQFVLLQGLIGMAFGLLRGILFLSNPVLGLLLGSVHGLLTLALLLPGFTVAIRRLHDTNRSGWWLLLAVPSQVGILLLLFGALALAYASASNGGLSSAFGPGASGWLAGFAIFASICIACTMTLFVFMCLKGTSGPNRFGADPLDPDFVPEAAVFDGGPDRPSPPPAPVGTAPIPVAPVYAPASPLQPTRTFGKRR